MPDEVEVRYECSCILSERDGILLLGLLVLIGEKDGPGRAGFFRFPNMEGKDERI